MLPISFPPYLNLHTLQRPRLQILISHIHPIESPKRSLELERLNGVPNLQYLIGRQGDTVRNGPLEDERRLTRRAGMGGIRGLFNHQNGASTWIFKGGKIVLKAVRGNAIENGDENEENEGKSYRYSNNTIRNEKHLIPMQHQTPIEMPARLDSRYTLYQLLRRPRRALNESNIPLPLCRRFLTKPLLVVRRYRKRYVRESGRPIDIGAVVVWMGDDNGFELAQRADLRDRSVVDEGYHIPHYVASRGAYYEGALAYGELEGAALASCAVAGIGVMRFWGGSNDTLGSVQKDQMFGLTGSWSHLFVCVAFIA